MPKTEEIKEIEESKKDDNILNDIDTKIVFAVIIAIMAVLFVFFIFNIRAFLKNKKV